MGIQLRRMQHDKNKPVKTKTETKPKFSAGDFLSKHLYLSGTPGEFTSEPPLGSVGGVEAFAEGGIVRLSGSIDHASQSFRGLSEAVRPTRVYMPTRELLQEFEEFSNPTINITTSWDDDDMNILIRNTIQLDDLMDRFNLEYNQDDSGDMFSYRLTFNQNNGDRLGYGFQVTSSPSYNVERTTYLELEFGITNILDQLNISIPDESIRRISSRLLGSVS